MDTGGHSPEPSQDGVGCIAFSVAVTLDILILALDDPRRARWSTYDVARDTTPEVLSGHADHLHEIATRPTGRRDVADIRTAVHAAKEAAISLQPYRGMPAASNYPPFGAFAHLVSQLIAELTRIERALESYG